jgi:CheY-like chemotaxis protein
MGTVKILYVEHDENSQKDVNRKIEDRMIYKDVEYELFPAKDPEEIIKHINKIAIDLVITDVYWPEPGDNSGTEPLVMLDKVIDVVRKHNSMVPIVALSGHEDAELEALKHEEDIYDIWSKNYGYPDFFIYRVMNLVERRQNKMGEHALLKATLKVLEKSPQAWNSDRIRKFIKDYFYLADIGEMLKEIKKFFIDLGNDAGMDNVYVEDTLDAFAKVEPLDLARKTGAWGHLRHSLSVFLAGYVLLNSPHSPFPRTEIFRSLRLQNWEEVNQAWCLACIFHDTSVFLEHLPELLKKFVDIPTERIKIRGKPFNPNRLSDCQIRHLDNDGASVSRILSSMGRVELYDLLQSYMKERPGDHGILAAVNVYEHGVNRGLFNGNSIVLENACYAILMHNCRDNRLKLTEEMDFLAQLLCFIDRFQAWGRENQYERLFDGKCFEKVVLRTFDLLNGPLPKEESKLIMKVDYLPFRTIAPGEDIIETNEDKLKGILRNHFDFLRHMGLYKENSEYKWQKIKLDFMFCISGRKIDI